MYIYVCICILDVTEKFVNYVKNIPILWGIPTHKKKQHIIYKRKKFSFP